MSLPLIASRYPAMAGRVDLVPGADYSAFQANVPIPTWAQFMVVKVSEGTSTGFDQDGIYSRAVAAGVPHVGAYHFARPASHSADQEADVFLREWDRHQWQLPPALDIEANESSLGDDVGWALRWGARVAAHTGRRPLLYSYFAYIQSHLLDARIAAMFDLWIGAPDYVPFDRPSNRIPPWEDWTMWQHTVNDIDNDVTTTDRLPRLLRPGTDTKEDMTPEETAEVLAILRSLAQPFAASMNQTAEGVWIGGTVGADAPPGSTKIIASVPGTFSLAAEAATTLRLVVLPAIARLAAQATVTQQQLADVSAKITGTVAPPVDIDALAHKILAEMLAELRDKAAA